MTVEIWHIKGARFHFGRHGLGQEKSGAYFPSDSLFSALVASIAITEGKNAVEKFTARFQGDVPPFLLTSAFPRVKKILFFPPPLFSAGGEEKEDVKAKKLKKTAYISEGVFRKIIAGSSLEREWKRCKKFHNETVLLTEEEAENLPPECTKKIRPEPLWKINRQPRVTIDRVANHSTIYHTGQVIFNEKAGLWFGVRWLVDDTVLRKKLENAFKELGHAGLGGERSSGYGSCEIERQSTTLELPNPAGKPWVSLSRYIPKADEISALNDEKSAYQIERIGGWVRSAQGKKDERRKAVHLLSEGAVLGALDVDAPGMMVDAQPSYGGKKPLGHPVYRNGLALGVGLEKGA